MAKIKVREILECKFAGLSWNQMKRTLHVSKDSVSAVCSAAERLGIRNLEQIPETSDDELYELFFPDKKDAQDVFECNCDYGKLFRQTHQCVKCFPLNHSLTTVSNGMDEPLAADRNSQNQQIEKAITRQHQKP